MYWSRTGSFIDLLAWAALSLVGWTGGWLLCTYLFRLRPRERFFAGVASGTLLWLLFSNLLAQAIPLVMAFVLAAFLVFALGGVAAWRATLGSRRKRKEERVDVNNGGDTRSGAGEDLSHAAADSRSGTHMDAGAKGARHPPLPAWVGRAVRFVLPEWPQVLAFGGLFLLFMAINRGLAIFDDYTNLPLVSIIATGDVPPHFYLDPDKILDYHYGLHLLAASLVRIGGFYPWSALDLYKAFSMALAVVLGVLWYRRFLNPASAWLVGGPFVLFAGGSRWLLLLFPQATLLRLGAGLQLEGSAMQTADTLYTALLSSWKIAGDGPVPFPLAFVSGIARPLTLALGGNSAMPLATLFLLLLLARRRWSPGQGLAYGFLMVSLALISDHLFAIVLGGLVLAVAVRWLASRRTASLDKGGNASPLRGWLWTILPGVLLAPVMGGVLTGITQRILSGASQGGATLPGIALRWPPVIFSAHLGALSLIDPSQLLISLIEMGPILLLAPWVLLAAKGYLRSGKLFMAGLSLMSLVSFMAPLFLRFVERERDITRLTGAALTIWMVLGFPYAWLAFRRAKTSSARGVLLRSAIGVGYVITLLGGIALLPVQMVAMAQTQPSYFVQAPDAAMSRAYWDALTKGAWVLDPAYPYRPAALFGRTTGPAYVNAYISLAAFDELVARFDPLEMARAGYAYIYLDRETWQRLTDEQKLAFQLGCVKPVAEQKDAMGDFRRLFDLHKCQKSP